MGMEDQLFKKFGKTIPKNTYLFYDGDPGNEMFVIQAGKVAIIKEAGGKEKILATMDKGDFFGEMSILTKKPRTATAKVVEDAQMLVINPSTFEAMVRGDANIAIKMLQKLADRLAETDIQIENLLLKDVNSKVVHYLVKKVGSELKQKDQTSIDTTLSISLISKMIFVDAKYVKDVFAKLIRNGLLEQVNGSLFNIPDLKNLYEFYDYLLKREKFREFN